MNTDPAQIRADVEDVLVGLPHIGPDAGGFGAAATQSAGPAGTVDPGQIDTIEAVGRRLEQAHQILVNALESVEKG